MTVDPNRAQLIFSAAAEATDDAARKAILDRLCAGDEQLRQRVEELLASHNQSGSFLNRPPAATSALFPTSIHTAEGPGLVIGPYKLLQHWDLFLGPALMRSYDWKYMRWAGWRDYGTGMLGMGGAHSCHMTFNALNLRALWEGNGGKPNTIRVEAERSDDEKDRFPNWEVVKFHFPARGSMPPATLTWAKGMPEDLQRLGITPAMEKAAGRTLDWGSGWAPTSGSLLIGSEGMVHTNMHNSECALLPLDRFPDQSGQPKRLPRAGSHEREWVNACRGEGPKPFSNFDYAGPIIELLLLGNICTLLGRPIEYDPASGKMVNDEQANGAVHPKRREGWELT